MATQNPSVGVMDVGERMKRHYGIFAAPMPTAKVLRAIYLAIVSGHFALYNFAPEVAGMADVLVAATLGEAMQKRVSNAEMLFSNASMPPSL